MSKLRPWTTDNEYENFDVHITLPHYSIFKGLFQKIKLNKTILHLRNMFMFNNDFNHTKLNWFRPYIYYWHVYDQNIYLNFALRV